MTCAADVLKQRSYCHLSIPTKKHDDAEVLFDTFLGLQQLL